MKNGGNFLLLDEPTNDLDLPTLRILEEALISFEGCVVIVSHDRYFLNRVCNGIISFEKNGQLYFSEGNYDYYIEKRKKRLSEKKVSIKEIKNIVVDKPKIRKLTWKEKKELETIEDDILKAESEVQKIEELFSLPDFYEKYSEQINNLHNQLEEAKLKAKQLYERWDELEKIKNADIS